jgi:hypothetical protein
VRADYHPQLCREFCSTTSPGETGTPLTFWTVRRITFAAQSWYSLNAIRARPPAVIADRWRTRDN